MGEERREKRERERERSSTLSSISSHSSSGNPLRFFFCLVCLATTSTSSFSFSLLLLSSFRRALFVSSRLANVSRDSTSVWRLALLLRSLISCVVLLNGASQPVLFLFTCDPLVSRCTMESLMNPRERT